MIIIIRMEVKKKHKVDSFPELYLYFICALHCEKYYSYIYMTSCEIYYRNKRVLDAMT